MRLPVLMLLLLVVSSCSVAAPSARDWPKEATVQLGEILGGSSPVARFTLHNPTDQRLECVPTFS